MAKPIESCRFEINSILNEKIIICSLGYVLNIQSLTNKKIVSTGITHFIVNSSSKIVFHQDFWDLSSLYDELQLLVFGQN